METSLTETDRQILTRLEGLYGPVHRTMAPDASRSATVARARRSISLVVRTTLLVGAALLLVVGTDPGRTMSVWVSDQLAVIHAVTGLP